MQYLFKQGNLYSKKCNFAVLKRGNKYNQLKIIGVPYNYDKNSKNLDTPTLQLSKVVNRQLDQANSIVIISHVNPDGDALGSSLALFHYLEKIGKRVSIFMPNEYPDYLKWLPGTNHVQIFNKTKSAGNTMENADLIFLLDFNNPSRSGKAEEYIIKSKAFKILIDHHPKPDNFADIVYSDTLSSSTAELIFRFIESTGNPELVDRIIATCLYTGIMSDTGSFSFNSSQPETYRVLSELLKRRIDKDYIYSMVYDNFSESRLRLLGYCLDKKMVVLGKFRTAYISLSLNEKKLYNYIRGDSEGFVNYPLSIKGIEFTAFFMENDDHIKISFRSKGNFDASAFASQNFAGGGHVNASGGESKLSMSETIDKFISLLPLYSFT
jgi:bifunctional oligoribonuclease and PAP phosphatase NrnA